MAITASLALFGCANPVVASPGATRAALAVPAAWQSLALTGVAVDTVTPAYVIVGAGGLILSESGALSSSAGFYSQVSDTALDLTAAAFGMVSGSAGFVAVGSGGTILTSPAGATWTGHSLFGVSSLSGVAFGNGTWVAVGSNLNPAGGTIVTSADGTSWTAVPLSGVPPLSAVAAGSVGGSSGFVAVGAKGTILTSNDGLHWTSVTSTVTSANLYGVAFGKVGTTPTPTFVAVGEGGTIVTSTNGAVSWSAPSGGSGTTQELRAVAYGTPGAGFVAVGAGGTMRTSSAGTSWSTPTLGPSLTTTAYLDGIAYDGSNFLWVGLPSSGSATIFYGSP